jgi:hypothetical protein
VREARGGFAGQLLAHPDGLGLALAAACLSGLLSRSWRAVALALFAALVAAGTLDPQQIAVLTQSGLRWGLWMQPFGAAALAVAALVHLRGDPPLPRLTDLGLAALLTTLLLGGPDLGLGPAPFGLPHAAAVAAGLIAWLGKLARRRLGSAPPAQADPGWLARLVLPLAAAQILAGTLRWPRCGRERSAGGAMLPRRLAPGRSFFPFDLLAWPDPEAWNVGLPGERGC